MLDGWMFTCRTMSVHVIVKGESKEVRHVYHSHELDLPLLSSFQHANRRLGLATVWTTIHDNTNKREW